jgi:hypothetical protein
LRQKRDYYARQPVALVTGANKRIGRQSRRISRPYGFAALIESRNLEHEETATKECWRGCPRALQNTPAGCIVNVPSIAGSLAWNSDATKPDPILKDQAVWSAPISIAGGGGPDRTTHRQERP